MKQEYMYSAYKNMKDWNKDKNELTWLLFDRGYTPECSPPEAQWVAYKYEFEYRLSYLSKSIWESPCGLLKNGIHSYNYMAYMGINWRPENNNPVYHCPFNRRICDKKHNVLNGSPFCECNFHFSNKPYDYDNSVELVEDVKKDYQQQLKTIFFRKIGWYDAWKHCDCITWNHEKYEWKANYDPVVCTYHCSNRICAITKKPLDGKKGNVFYDVKVTRVRHDGSLWEGQKVITINKGKKAFDHPIPLPICEAYVKRCKDKILDREKSRLHREIFASPDTEVEVLNIRAEVRETRDLLQDLADVRDGLTVTHNSDLIKNAKAEKHERRIKAAEMKLQKSIKKWRETGDELSQIRLMKKGYTEEELDQMRQKPVEQPKKKADMWRMNEVATGEQVTLF